MVGAGPAGSFRVNKKDHVVFSRAGWQISTKLLSEQQANIRDSQLMFLRFLFSSLDFI